VQLLAAKRGVLVALNLARRDYMYLVIVIVCCTIHIRVLCSDLPVPVLSLFRVRYTVHRRAGQQAGESDSHARGSRPGRSTRTYRC
jgi:hypothetical protein